jgi:hypothetical protein
MTDRQTHTIRDDRRLLRRIPAADPIDARHGLAHDGSGGGRLDNAQQWRERCIPGQTREIRATCDAAADVRRFTEQSRHRFGEGSGIVCDAARGTDGQG